MIFEIYEWEEIKDQFLESTLIIGNGSSVALDDAFSYKSLKEYAENNKCFDQNVLELFKEFDTDDFELILRLVWHATVINEKLGVRDKKTKKAYENIRDALISTVRDIHSNYDVIDRSLLDLYNFTQKFRTIISLNYDLIMYWILMYGNSKRDGHKFKDCFIRGRFNRNWYEFRNKLYEKENTLVFYPHGNLCLARDIEDEEFKIEANGHRLLDRILSNWDSNKMIPLFISEGTKDKKLKAIETSAYLNTVYYEVIPEIFKSYKRSKEKNFYNLVIYGWSLGEHDEHILRQILLPINGRSRNIRGNKLAISIYKINNEKCTAFYQKIKKIISEDIKLEIYFFDSSDAGCWNNP